ncbi:MAG: HIRAN domain-containing protein, partial [Promethearchaeia archaeon]
MRRRQTRGRQGSAAVGSRHGQGARASARPPGANRSSQHHAGRKLQRLRALSLVREPDNAMDPNAIAVHAQSGQLGYLPAIFSGS